MDIVCEKCGRRMNMCSRCEPLSSHAVLGEVRELKRKLPGWANAESHSVQLDLYYNKAIDDVLKILTKHFA
jgi:hypothetical protein